MDFDKAWNKALSKTEIIRSRVMGLQALKETQVPYIMLSESMVNEGDTVVRKGEVLVEKPAIIVPPNNPQFYGFEFDGERQVNENSLINFLIVRGVTLPSLRYDNRTSSLDVFEGRLSRAIEHYRSSLQKQENVSTGLIAAPEDVWQFSLLIFIASQVMKNAQSDIKKLLDEFHKKNNDQ